MNWTILNKLVRLVKPEAKKRSQMGGFTRFAATGRVQLRRTNEQGIEDVFSLDYDAIEAGMSSDGMVELYPGDVIVVPQRRLFE